MKREEVLMKVWFSIFALAAALTIGVSSPGSAHQVVVGKLKIGHPWVREAAEGAPGTYSCIIEIQNDGDEPERLLGATIEGAGTGVLYKLTENNGHFTSRPGFGTSDLVTKAPMSADDHHRIGSVTKTLTGEAVLLLVDEGKIGPQGAVTEDTGILGYRRREPRARRRRACGRVRQNGKPRCYNFNPDPERGGREQLWHVAQRAEKPPRPSLPA
jgi:hypothetical protein